MNSLFGACHLNHPTQQSGLNDIECKQAMIFLNKLVLLYLPLSESGCYDNIHALGNFVSEAHDRMRDPWHLSLLRNLSPVKEPIVFKDWKSAALSVAQVIQNHA